MAVKSNGQTSALHDIISKDSTRTLIIVSVTVFIAIFCMIAAKTLVSQIFYQNKVVSEKKSALKVVEDNGGSSQELALTYVSFATENPNVLGGSRDGKGPKDGDNAKLVLDSLPDELDYPALSSSIEKILLDGGYGIQSLGGGDAQELLVSDDEGSPTSLPVEIEYPLKVEATPQTALSLLQTLEASIRPFDITTLKIEASSNNLELTIGMKTYYQSSSGLQVSSKVVK